MKTNKLLTAIFIGILAGTMDVIPMLIQGLSMYACVSAFTQWVVLGILIPYFSWNIKPWFKGLIIAELTAIPIMILVAEKEVISIIPIFLFSAVLGVLVGMAGNKFVK